MNKYELHITVDPIHTSQDLRYGYGQQCPIEDGRKILDIILDSGKHQDQLMAGFHFESPTYLGACAASFELVNLIDANLKIVRIKLEADPDNQDDPSPIYWEAHWKVKRGALMRHERFRMPVFRSFNREQPDIEYWTIRTDSLTKHNTFHACYRLITEWLEKRQDLLKKPHRELVLLDSNIGLDVGWEEYGG